MIRAEVERQVEASNEESAEFTDPSEFSQLWNINAMTVAFCKSMFCWQEGEIWNPEDGMFESIDTRYDGDFHTFQQRVKEGLWPSIVSLVRPFLLSL